MDRSMFVSVGVALCVLVCVAVACCACVGGNGENFIQYRMYSDSADYKVGDADYSGQAISEVKIYWSCGRIELSNNNSGQITLSESGKELAEQQRMRSLIKDGELKVHFWQSGLKASAEDKDKYLSVSVPSGCDISIECSSAEIVFSGDIICKDLEIDTSSGGLRAGKIVAEEADFSSSSGSYNIDSLTATEGESDFSSGSLRIGELNVKEMDSKTSSGGIVLGLKSCNSLSLKSSSGDIALRLIDDFGITLSFSTSSGRLVADKGGPVYNDGHCSAVIKTSSGNLEIIE